MSQEGHQDPLHTDTPPPDTPPAPGEEEADSSTARELEPCNGTKAEGEQQGEAEDGDTENNRNTQSSAEEKVTLEEEGRKSEIESSCLDPVTENVNRDISEGGDTESLLPQSSGKDSTKPLCALRLVK